MDRITHPTATAGNLFTDGDPGNGIASTRVVALWLNGIQEEVATFIEGQGITLNAGDNTQLNQAIGNAIAAGGTSQTSSVILNNQSSAQSIVGLSFNSSTVKAVRILFDLHRQTDSIELDEVGELFITFKPVAGTWHISHKSSNEDSETSFSITSGGQVQYVTSDLAGSNYSGIIRITSINTISQ